MQYVAFHNLETPHLILRDIRMEDIQEYYERLFGDGDVCRYLLFDPHQDIGESYESIQNILEQYEAGKFYRWGITEKGDDSLIGIIGLGITELIMLLGGIFPTVHYMVFKAIATVVVLAWNYLARKLLLYK